MKKIIVILAVLILGVILVMPVSALEPKMSVKVETDYSPNFISHCVNPGDYIEYQIWFTPQMFPFDPGNPDWDLNWVMTFDATSSQLDVNQPLGPLSSTIDCEDPVGAFGFDNYCDGASVCCGGNPGSGDSTGFIDFEVNAPYNTKINTHISAKTWGPRYGGKYNSNNPKTFDFSYQFTVCPEGYKAPEFPSPFLPAIAIIGMLGAVLLIQRTREH